LETPLQTRVFTPTDIVLVLRSVFADRPDERRI